MRKILTGFFVVIFLFVTVSLCFGELKIDDLVLMGKLNNGLSYYVKENKFHEEKASLRLLVKVGSALETEEERGIAHFLEHMVFRGSENYKDYEVVKYLESIGAEFGPDTNAFTTYDKTCYILEIPLKNKEDLEKGIMFLSDFAFKAKLEEEKVDKERSRVLDELRRISGPYMRVFDKHLKVILKDTVYEDKFPIGKEEIIKNCSSEVIRKFYEKWYTPHNMAVIAVGDFDKDVAREYIEKYFSVKKENGPSPKYEVNPNQTIDFSIVKDPEISLASIQLISRKTPFAIDNEEDVKGALISSIIINILNERYQTLSASADTEFISASFFENTFLANLSLQGLFILCWEDKVLEGLERVLYESVKLGKSGIKEDEFKRAVKMKKQLIEKEISNLEKRDNNEYVLEYFNHFIHQNKLFSKQSVLELEKEILNDLTFEEVATEVDDLNFDLNCSICVTLPENIDVCEEAISEVIGNVQNIEMEKEKENGLNEQELLRPKLEIEGKIQNITKSDKTDITEVVFENGMKFFLKPTDLKRNEIILRSFAIGGLANVKKDIYDSAKIALEYFYDSGIAGIDPANFSKILDLKNSNLNVALSYNSRNISATITKDNFEDIIKLINRIFTSKNYQADMWNKTIKIEKEKQKFCHLYPDMIFYEKANNIFTSDSYLVREINLDLAELKKAQDIIDAFFSNPKDFTFFIVGDFEVDQVILVLQKYLGAISNEKKSEIELTRLPEIVFPEKNSTQIVRAGREDKSFCIIGYDLVEFDSANLKNWYLLKLMRPIIKNRLLQALVLDGGKTYAATNYPDYYFYPNLKHFNYFISFSGPQDSIESIKDTSVQALEDLMKNGLCEKEFEVAKKILENDIKERLKYNTFIATLMMSSKMLGYENYEDYEQIIDSISLDEMFGFIKTVFAKEKSSSVIWLPNE